MSEIEVDQQMAADRDSSVLFSQNYWLLCQPVGTKTFGRWQLPYAEL